MRYAIAGLVFGLGSFGVLACLLSSRISERERTRVTPQPSGNWIIRGNGRDVLDRLRDAGL